MMLVYCVGSLCFVMYMNITKILNSGSFAGFVRDGVEKKSDFQFSILPNLSRFPDRKNKDT